MGKSMHRAEKEILKRDKQLEYPTDRLGPTSLLTQVSHINSSRVIMLANQMGHMVSIKNPEPPLIPTGFENELARYSSMLDETDADYEIVAKFQKNDYIYVLIGYDKKHKVYHAWKREEAKEHSEGFATRYNNGFIDSLEIGDVVDEGTIIKKSTNFDKHMNYQYGRNVNTVYLVSPYVYEDGILAMNGAEKMFNTFKSNEKHIKLSENEVLINWYGDDDNYQGLPLVGEKTRKGYVAAVRKTDSGSAMRSLKNERLRHMERSDRPCMGTGRVIDIEIHTNKDPHKFAEASATKLIADLYDQQQAYYKKLYYFMDEIKQNRDIGGYTYTDSSGIIMAEAWEYIDAAAFYADSNDNVYGSMEIVVHLLDEEQMIVGSKFVGRAGNKGVIAKILPPEKSWHMEDGTPIHFVVAALGIVGRLNQSQLYEHSATELGATCVRMMQEESDPNEKIKHVYKLLKFLNPDEGKELKAWFKKLSDKEKVKFCKRIEQRGVTIIQDPIDNADILDYEAAYEVFPPHYQRIVFDDGGKSMRKVLCSKMLYFRLKQDPLEKYSARSKGPVNPISTLPSKSNLKKKSIIPYSDVPVRFGEMEMEIMNGMVPHPYAIADFMMENSTSYKAKEKLSYRGYLNGIYDSEDITDTLLMYDMEPEDLEEMSQQEILDMIYDEGELSGKKNIEQISALLAVLGTEIDVEVEEAPEGTWFEG